MLKEIEEIEKQYGHGSLAKSIPTARIFEVFSSTHSIGKTALALYKTAIVQRKGGIVLYIDADNTLNYDYVKNMGVDTKELFVSLENNAIDICNLIEDLVKENKISLIIVDTITALMFHNKFGEGFTRLVGLIIKSNVDVFFLHQKRWKYENRSNLRTLIQVYIEREKTNKTLDGKVIGYTNIVTVHKNSLLLQKYLFDVKQINKKFHISIKNF